MAKAIPEGYTAVTPYLIVKGAAQAIQFYVDAFGAQELFRMPMPGGKIGHAELQIGDARLMLADESPEAGAYAPKGDRLAVSFQLYCNDCDAIFKKALEHGAREIRPVKDQFYGDRSGMLMDPFGHTWNISTHVEDVSPEEMERRMAAMTK